MDSIVPYLYKEYGKYINSFRAFPLDIDGLKPAERRVLLSAYQIAKNKLVKCAKIDGFTTGNFHPHGSVYGTIVQLVRQGLLDGQGNFGCNFGAQPIGAAAMRYTETKLSDMIKDIAFKYVEYVKWEINDLDEKEPKFLPTMFPLCFCGTEYTQGLGFGYKTMIPCYKVKDLYKRLLWLLNPVDDEPIIRPITNCSITSSDEELKELLTTGKASISVNGVVQEKVVQCKVILKSWAPGKKFESILNKFSKELDNQDIGFTDSSVTDTEIVFQVLKLRNRDVIYKKFVKKLKNAIKGNIIFQNNIVNIAGTVKLKSVDQMLLSTYHNFSKINGVVLKYKIYEINKQIKEYKILEKIRPSLSTTLRNKLETDAAITQISQRSGVSKKDVNYVFDKYRISKLLNLRLDTTDFLNSLDDLTNDLNNLDEFVLNQYNELFS